MSRLEKACSATAAVEAAVAAYRALDRRGEPVLTSEREAYLQRVEEAREAAREAWGFVSTGQK